MNKFIAMGRLTTDPEVKYVQEGKAVARFNFAVNRRFHRDGEPEADFFTCVAFGKSAETIEKHVKKGTKLLIDGEVRNNNYTDKDGVKHYGTQVVVNSFEFCESKSASGASDTESAPAPAKAPTNSDGFMSIPDGIEDDFLPFN